MKKLLITLILLIASTSYAAGPAFTVIAGGGGAVAAACSTIVDSDTTGSVTVDKLADATIIKYGGRKTTEAYCICKVTFSIKKSGTPNGNITAAIYASAANAPTGAALATSSTVITQADVTTSYADYTFTFSSCANLDTGTIYFAALESDATNASAYFAINMNSSGGANSCGTGLACRTYKYVSSWAATDNSADIYKVTYK
jgi:hypothetical protein